MAQTLLYISKRCDKDLLGLLCNIGDKNFRKVVRYSMHALSDSAYINKAKELARNARSDEAMNVSLQIGVGIRIRVQLDQFSQKLLAELEAGTSSMFVKTVVRQVLGPQVLLKYYIKSESNIEIKEVPFASLINIGQIVYEKKERPTKFTRSVKPRRIPEQSVTEPIIPAVSERTTDTPSFEQPSSPSFGPTFSAPVHEEIPNVSTSPTETQSNNDDFDILSMLEAML